MAFEKNWAAVAPELFTADGTNLGIVTIANTYGFHVKQLAIISATGLPDLTVQVKRVLSLTQLIVGPIPTQVGQSLLSVRTDISAYTVSSGAFIYAQEQSKSPIKLDDIEFATYDNDPIVAVRVVGVDQLGNYWSSSNPLPVSVNTSSVSSPTIYNVSAPTANTEVSQLLPDNTTRFLIRVRNNTATLKFSFISGTSGTNYVSVPRGSYYEVANVLLPSLTIYFQTNNANQIIEILAWS